MSEKPKLAMYWASSCGGWLGVLSSRSRGFERRWSPSVHGISTDGCPSRRPVTRLHFARSFAAQPCRTSPQGNSKPLYWALERCAQ